MHKKLMLFVVVALLALGLPAAVFAQGATGQTWSSSITYYTPSATGGTLQVNYYASDGTMYAANPITLQGHKAGSLLIGSVSAVPTSFSGSAVLSSDVPVVATYVQFANGSESGSFGRLLYSAFSADNAATPFYIPTFLYQQGTTTRVGVQNVEAFDIDATLRFYPLGNPTPVEKIVTIKSQASYIFTGQDAGLAAGFNGSLVISAHRTGDAAVPGRVVAAAQETSDAKRQAYAFEGVATGANQVYLASMLCRAGAARQISYYAIQNAGPGTASVTIRAYNTAGTEVGQHGPFDIPEGAKISVNPCTFGTPVADNTSGSAVIESTGGQVIAIGKVIGEDGVSTAFVGSSGGATKVAAPYIRWAANDTQDFRSFVAIMNVGTQPATNISVVYYDGNGTAVATQPLATAGSPLNPLIKRNTDASGANALSNGAFGFAPPGGAVEVISDQPVVVVVRLVKRVVNVPGVSALGEDYSGVPVP